jgi:hypothetical protein
MNIDQKLAPSFRLSRKFQNKKQDAGEIKNTSKQARLKKLKVRCCKTEDEREKGMGEVGLIP